MLKTKAWIVPLLTVKRDPDRISPTRIDLQAHEGKKNYERPSPIEVYKRCIGS